MYRLSGKAESTIKSESGIHDRHLGKWSGLAVGINIVEKVGKR